MRVPGFEPRSPAPKAGRLAKLPPYPQSLRGENRTPTSGSTALRTTVILHRDIIKVRETGFEPATRGSSGPRSPRLSYARL